MTTYAVRFRAPGAPLTDDLARQFYDAFDGALVQAHDTLILTVFLDGDDVVSEAQDAVPLVESACGVDIAAVDLDLVNTADIARRTGRSRQSVQYLVAGRRGPGSFPPPLGAPGASKVWEWSQVDAWFRQYGSEGEYDEEVPLGSDEAAIVNGWLAARNCRRRSDRSEARVFSTSLTDTEPGLTEEAMREAASARTAVRVQHEVRVMVSS